MPRTIEFRRPGDRSAQEIASIGGWWLGPAAPVGSGFESTWHEAKRHKLMEARSLQSKDTTAPLRYTLSYRPELISVMHVFGTPLLDGFDPLWVKRTPLDHLIEVAAEWQQAGYTMKLHPSLDAGWFEASFPGGWQAEQVPTPYVIVQGKELWVQAVLADLASAAYRSWLRAHLEQAMAWSGADAVFLGIKRAWLSYPQESRLRPNGLRLNATGEFAAPWVGPAFRANGIEGQKSVITDTPYKAGEFEEGYRRFTGDLDELGIRIITQVVPKRTDPDFYAPFAPASNSWLGEIRLVP